MQGGISTADRIVTVSPGYAWEIQTPEGGWGMEQMLGSRAYALNGVLNGIDTTDWNPVTDKHLEHKFGISNFSRGKVGTLAGVCHLGQSRCKACVRWCTAACCRRSTRLPCRRSFPCRSGRR